MTGPLSYYRLSLQYPRTRTREPYPRKKTKFVVGIPPSPTYVGVFKFGTETLVGPSKFVS